MFPREYDYWRSRGSIARSRERLGLNDQRLWSVKESLDQEGVILPNHSVYAQNDTYLELTHWRDAAVARRLGRTHPPRTWSSLSNLIMQGRPRRLCACRHLGRSLGLRHARVDRLPHRRAVGVPIRRVDSLKAFSEVT